MQMLEQSAAQKPSRGFGLQSREYAQNPIVGPKESQCRKVQNFVEGLEEQVFHKALISFVTPHFEPTGAKQARFSVA
jgi:hypothetical protein